MSEHTYTPGQEVEVQGPGDTWVRRRYLATTSTGRIVYESDSGVSWDIHPKHVRPVPPPIPHGWWGMDKHGTLYGPHQEPVARALKWPVALLEITPDGEARLHRVGGAE